MARDNHGRFLPGEDKDRHGLTTAERRRGWKGALLRAQLLSPDGGTWLYTRVAGWYRGRDRQRRRPDA